VKEEGRERERTGVKRVTKSGAREEGEMRGSKCTINRRKEHTWRVKERTRDKNMGGRGGGEREKKSEREKKNDVGEGGGGGRNREAAGEEPKTVSHQTNPRHT
jgi:hypothetical protein